MSNLDLSGVRFINRRRVDARGNAQRQPQRHPINVSSPYYGVTNNQYVGGNERTSQRDEKQMMSADGKKSFDFKSISELFGKTDMSINGALVGGGIGLGVALYRRQHYLVSVFVGGTFGFLISNLLFKNYSITKK